MSYRKQQVESTLRRALSHVLSVQMSDPRIRGMVSVTSVDVSPDLHTARVGVSVLPETYQKRTIQGLRHAGRHIHAQVCKQVRMRTVPQFVFHPDDSIKKQAQVFAAINQGLEQDQHDRTAPDEQRTVENQPQPRPTQGQPK